MIWLMLTIFLILGALTWVTSDRSGHRWVYRNPYTRTCQGCGRQEDNYCSSWAWEAKGFRAIGWWEEMRPGSGQKCSGKHSAGGDHEQ